MLSEEAKDLSEGAKALFKKICDGNKNGTVLKYYESIREGDYDISIRKLFIYTGNPLNTIREDDGRKKAELESYLKELKNESYLESIEISEKIGSNQETYQITKKGYDFYDKELSEVK